MHMSIVQAQTNNSQDINELLNQWIEAERSGVRFPVPFEAAWRIAEYSTKANAKRAIKDLDPDTVSSQMMNVPSSNASGVTRIEDISFSVDGFKDFCLMAKTEAGRLTRKYFIEAERKWRLVQQVAPLVASEVEMMDRQIELAKWEAKKAVAEAKALAIRDYATRCLPQPVADRILGVTEIKTTEIKEVVIDQKGQILGHVPGDSYNKKELCERYGLLTRTGKPDYKQLNAYLDGLKLPGDAWDDRMVVAHNSQLKAKYLPELDKLLGMVDQQRWIGE